MRAKSAYFRTIAAPLVLLALAVSTACMMSVLAAQNTAASSAVGGAGPGPSPGGGGGGGPREFETRNGFGWYQYDVDKPGPRDFYNGDSWNRVRNVCRNLDSQYVIMYIIQRSSGGPQNAQVRDFFNQWPESYTGYKGNSGHPWMNNATARARYNQMNISAPGYTFGQNVGWFCYSDGSFNLQNRSYVKRKDASGWGNHGRQIRVTPGTELEFRHQVQNTGRLNADFRQRIDTNYDSGNWVNGNWADSHVRANSTWTSPTYSRRVPNNAANGAWYCQRHNTDKTSSSNSRNLQSTRACAIVEYQWRLDPSVNITSGSDDRPGQEISWNHQVINRGPNPTTRSATFRAQNQGHAGGGTAGSRNIASGMRVGSVDIGRFASERPITQNDVGNNVCRRTTVTPVTHSNNGTANSGNACRFIPYRYELLPRITNITDGSVIDPAQESIPVVGSVENRGTDIRTGTTRYGPTKSHSGIRWQTTKVIYDSSPSDPANKAGGTSGNNPCQYFAGSTSCDSIASGSREFPGGHYTGPSTNTPFNEVKTSIGDLAVGSKICFALSVQRHSSNSTQWRHSPLTCMIVGKKPKVQVHGGGLSVGRGFDTGSPSSAAQVITSTTDRRASNQPFTARHGSWVEYGIFAPGSITGIASSSGFNSDMVRATDSVASRSSLTYTNTGIAAACDGGYGCYASASNLPDPGSRYPVTDTTPRTGTVDVASRTGVVTNVPGLSPTVNVRGGQVGPGRSLIINAPNATVNITGNITYHNGPYQRTEQLPQVIIIANTINIQHEVTQVDAWLVSKGSGDTQGINTCSTHNGSPLAVTAPLSSKLCDRPLTINGPVVANKLFLRRTHGAEGSNFRAPAEVINLRPDAYLWANEHMTSEGALRTSSVRETTPRF